VRNVVGQFVRKSWEQLLPAILQSAFSIFSFYYSCLVRYPWREVRHLCLAIKPRVCFRNHSLSRIKIKVLEGGFDLWLGDNITILSMVKRAHPLLSNTDHTCHFPHFIPSSPYLLVFSCVLTQEETVPHFMGGRS
jgi:hypothetical protein